MYMKKLLSYECKRKEFDLDTATILKGIAIIMMLWHHLFFREDVVQTHQVNFAPFSQFNMVYIAKCFKICVPIFVFISGYGLWLSYRKSNKKGIVWVCDRIVKLLSNFWIIYIFSFIFTYFIDERPRKVYFSENVYQGMLNILFDMNGVAALFGTESLLTEWWYLSAAIIFIVCIPFIAKIRKFSFLIIFVIVIPRITKIGFLGGMTPCSFFFIFLLGIMASEYKLIERFIAETNVIVRFVIETLIIILGYKSYSKIPLEIFWELQWGIFPIFVILFSCEFIACIPIVKRILKFLGKHSANIYLIHNFLRCYFFEHIYYRSFISSFIILLGISLMASIFIEQFKKIIKYTVLINGIRNDIERKLIHILGDCK